ncbi:type VII secretion protein EssA [Rummeliibacillus sp. JY-2-4R]
MKHKWSIALLLVWFMFGFNTPVQAEENNGNLTIDINRINQDKTKIDSTENKIKGTEDVFTDDSIKLENEIKQNEKNKESDSMNALFQKGFMKKQDTLSTNGLFQEQISVSNIQQDIKTESSANRWLFVTILFLVIAVLCFGVFLYLKKLNVGESNE